MSKQSTGTAALETTVTHQNVELRRGRHGSPDQGACVVELASMLAGEPFSDHPRSVCPVIAAYMRVLNDGLGDEPRQRLFAYAAAIVDTRGSRQLRRARVRTCLQWSREMGAISGPRARLLARWGTSQAAGALSAKAALRFGVDDSLALALADALIGVGPWVAAGPQAKVPAGASASSVPDRVDGQRAGQLMFSDV